MKKIVLISLLVDLIIVITAVSVFTCNSSDSLEQQIVDICKMIIQATIAGTITFTGLLLTFLSQEQQTKIKNQLELCPCFIIENCNSLSAIKTKNDITKDSDVLICSTAANIRTVECTIVNCKDTYGLNVCLETCNGTYKLGNLKSQDIELILAVNGKKEDGIVFNFEDVYGRKYEQNIKYTYRSSNDIVFTSSQPKRRK